MLQIVQGVYFRPVALTDTLHRGIFYTNLWDPSGESFSFIFGRLAPSTTFHGVHTLTVEAKEQLETLTLSGSREILVATTGDQLLDEIAAVIAFCLNVTCVRDYDLAQRLIATGESDEAIKRGPSRLLRQTFDARVVLTKERVADLDQFVRSLVGLGRKNYEASLRAIRQFVAATALIQEDASLAYTLMVAALESLGQTTVPQKGKWTEYDARKRERIDVAIEELDLATKDRIRTAVLANEHLALQRRFVAFVINHIEPTFFRSEAAGAILPVTAADLPNSLREAYAIRSRNVHALEELAREVWVLGHHSDTTRLESGVVLSLEGLARLSRHVIRRFIERAPKEVDGTFNYRSALPGIVKARLASRYWIHNPEGLTAKTAPNYFDGMIQYYIEISSQDTSIPVIDMTKVLDRIEVIAIGLSNSNDRLPMAGIISLWNALAPTEFCRTLKHKLAARFEGDLSNPSMVSFALAMVLGNKIDWPTETFAALARHRLEERRGRKAAPMPARIDAALHLCVAEKLLQQGQNEEAMKELGHAVETVPGLIDLIKYEAALERGEDPTLMLDRFVFGETEFVEWAGSGQTL